MYYPLLGYYGYDAKRIFQVFSILVIHALLINKLVFLRYIYQLTFSSLACLVIIIFASGFLSAILSTTPFYALGDWLHTLLLLNSVFIIASAASIYPISRYLLLGSAFAGMGLAIISFSFSGLFELFLGKGTITPQKTYLNVANIRFLNQIHIQLLFLFAGVACLVSRFQAVFILVGGLSIYMLLVGYSRGVVLSLGVVLFISFLIGHYSSNRALKSLLLVYLKMCVFGVTIFLVVDIYYSLVFEKDELPAKLLRVTYTRLDMWGEIIKGILQSPEGIGAYHYSGFNDPAFGFPYSHPHNFLLQITLEWGVVAGIALLVAVIGLLVKAIKYLGCLEDPLVLGLILSVITTWCYGMFSGVFVMPASQLVFVSLFGVLLSYFIPMQAKNDKTYTKKRLYYYSMPIIFVALSAYGLYALYSYKLYQKALESSPTSDYQMKTRGPRFWIEGGIVEPID